MVLEELENVGCHASALGVYTLGNLHVHVELNVGLRKGQDEVYLMCNPSIDD